MARVGKTAQEFIQSSFSPIVAVLCSQKVDNVVAKNNLSFTELLQPFACMDWEGKMCKTRLARLKRIYTKPTHFL